MAELTYREPEPIRLPIPGRAMRARRMAHSLAAAGRHFAPMAARKVARRPQVQRPAAHALRRMFEDLGATYVKFGQAVASSPAVIPESIAEEFRSCLDSGPAVPFRQVRAVVEADLGMPLETAFAEFSRKPVAAASIAVVHRARLHDGSEVAVKVLRPGIAEVVASDLDLMEPLFRILARQGVEPAYSAVGYLIGLREQVAEELDLRNEVRTMAYFRELFTRFGLHRLVIPRVEEHLCGPNVLTMEFMVGAPIDDLANVEKLGHDPAPLVAELLQAWLLTALRAGVFHADIHAGNLFLLDDGRLAMLDWGIVARLDADGQDLFRAIVRCALGEEAAWDDVTAHTLRAQKALLQDGFGYSYEDVRDMVRLFMEPVLTKPLKDVSMAALFMSPEQAAKVNHGVDLPQRSLMEHMRRNRAIAKAFRRAMDGGTLESPFNRSTFLSAKQLLYLERYGRMYLPDRALLADHDFLRAALAG
jgi:predicted unusual protein kinase regulating ubiquinone biosynthesis (AarF/ABC1/UbiB family)